MDLTAIERQTLAEFLAVPGPVRSAVQKFAANQQLHFERMSAQSLRTVPRQLEQACDQAAKAECYSTLIADLERFTTK